MLCTFIYDSSIFVWDCKFYGVAKHTTGDNIPTFNIPMAMEKCESAFLETFK